MATDLPIHFVFRMLLTLTNFRCADWSCGSAAKRRDSKAQGDRPGASGEAFQEGPTSRNEVAARWALCFWGVTVSQGDRPGLSSSAPLEQRQHSGRCLPGEFWLNQWANLRATWNSLASGMLTPTHGRCGFANHQFKLVAIANASPRSITCKCSSLTLKKRRAFRRALRLNVIALRRTESPKLQNPRRSEGSHWEGTPRGIRTPDLRIRNPGETPGKQGTSKMVAPMVATDRAENGCERLISVGDADPDLARLVSAWPTLSVALKRMILAALDASRESDR